MAEETNEVARAAQGAELGTLRERVTLGARAVFGLLVLATALMAVARYL
jgi:hypothetical protein